MPKPSNNSVGNQLKWKDELESSRLRNLRRQKNIGEPFQSTAQPMKPIPPSPVTSGNWAQQLERNRARFAHANAQALPGPGAAAGGTAFPMQKNKLPGLKKAASPADSGQYGAAKEGLIGYIFMLMATASEQATKPALKQLISWHWGLLPTVKGTLISLLVTGPALNTWLLWVHIFRRRGLCKFDVFDLLAILLYDFLVCLLVGAIIAFWICMITGIYCMVSPSNCPIPITTLAGLVT